MWQGSFQTQVLQLQFTQQVSSVLPRPELSELLGISYRRIPVLAIGNDVYCDTSLIAYALERRFPASAGHGSIFPKRKGGKADTGMIKAFQTYTDKMVFSLAGGQLPWNKFPEAFLKDRSEVCAFALIHSWSLGLRGVSMLVERSMQAR